MIRRIALSLLVAVMTGCTVHPTDPEAMKRVSAAMDANLKSEFAKVTFEFTQTVDLRNGPVPGLLFKGADSTILALDEPNLEKRFATEVRRTGLARTPNGRYVLFTVSAPLRDLDRISADDDTCTAPGCRAYGEFRLMSETEAKAWLFTSKVYTPEKYKAIFKEAPPPSTIPA